jgi:hypothetical protein
MRCSSMGNTVNRTDIRAIIDMGKGEGGGHMLLFKSKRPMVGRKSNNHSRIGNFKIIDCVSSSLRGWEM